MSVEEWALDVSFERLKPCFVPLRDGVPVFGLAHISDRSPGPLVGVVSDRGYEHAKKWAQDNPNWQQTYCELI